MRDFSIEEGDESPLLLELNTPTAVPLQLSLDIKDGSANRAVDLGPYVSNITFDPGLLSQQIILSAIDDPFDEPMEHMWLQLHSDIIQVPEDPTRITIVDNDPLPTIDVMPLKVIEGDKATLEFTLSEPSNKLVSVFLDDLPDNR